MVRKVNILLIEDNPGDVGLTEEALRRSGASCNLNSIQDPAEALALLRGEGPHKDRVKPELIFLDMNLPKYSGLDLIENIRKTKGLEHTPIVVLSGSANPEDVRNVYRLGGNCFIRKPMQLDEFIYCMTTCYEFWCNVAVLPAV